MLYFSFACFVVLLAVFCLLHTHNIPHRGFVALPLLFLALMGTVFSHFTAEHETAVLLLFCACSLGCVAFFVRPLINCITTKD